MTVAQCATVGEYINASEMKQIKFIENTQNIRMSWSVVNDIKSF